MALRALTGSEGPLVLIDCPPSLGLLTVNALFAADVVLVVTEPGAWAVDGVARMFQTVERIRLRRTDGRPEVVGIAVNRLGRTRDGRYWNEQLEKAYPGRCLPPIRLRAAVAEAAAQSLPIHALGRRPGAAEAAADRDARVAATAEAAPAGEEAAPVEEAAAAPVEEEAPAAPEAEAATTEGEQA